jgi:5-methylcytosine-specific restriction endonuclease McrBC GTP-binding regulatory subunit McrB
MKVVNIWAVSCGRAGNNQWQEMWPEWKEKGIITIGCNCKFPIQGTTLEYIRKEISELEKDNQNITPRMINRQSDIAYRFSNDIKKGDIIISRVGKTKILGLGTIEDNETGYTETPYTPGSHYNYRKIKWLKVFDTPNDIENSFFLQDTIESLHINCSIDYSEFIYNGSGERRDQYIQLTKEILYRFEQIEYYHNKRFNNMKNNSINSIFYGPPGTGKTYITAEKAVEICSGDFEINDAEDAEDERKQIMDEYNKLVEAGKISFVTFHQSYGYEEFVEGLKPKLDKSSDDSSDDETKESGQVNYHIPNGVFKEICIKAKKDIGNNYVIIIDEINRGNISKIFGELITLIEEDKREGRQNAISVILPYSKKEFSVPSNVYIIGTMNTADRSLANVDTALRRRFHFEPMMPDPTALSGLHINDIDIQKLLEVINQRIGALYDREHTIGHAYFTEFFENKVIPLLEEYFFDDWQKIHLVLGDNKKPADYQFIKEIETNYSELFGNNDLTDSYSTKSYQINKRSFDKPQSYIGIYTVQNNEQ